MSKKIYVVISDTEKESDPIVEALQTAAVIGSDDWCQTARGHDRHSLDLVRVLEVFNLDPSGTLILPTSSKFLGAFFLSKNFPGFDLSGCDVTVITIEKR